MARQNSISACPTPTRAIMPMIKAFEQKTGCGVIVNTSFNVRANLLSARLSTPTNALCAPKWDCLVLENFYLKKKISQKK
jgi:predicted NodU family carbamoyl transferase